ncbi:hypothetical protein PybrP1_003201 [[Pythium] brassicae (nom. inval.)]|nr:hypothetical protein PybrP1_003201 [[Pythium] brassicae (nom. inval.)]
MRRPRDPDRAAESWGECAHGGRIQRDSSAPRSSLRTPRFRDRATGLRTPRCRGRTSEPRHGAAVSASDSYGCSVLRSAIETTHYDIVAELMSRGADVNYVTPRDRTARGSTLKLAADTPRSTWSLAVVLRLTGHRADAADVDAVGHQGQTPLHIAASFSQSKTVRVLLVSGADVNARDRTMQTPLFGAVRCSWSGIVEELLAHGADVNAQDDAMVTPLELASQSESDRVANQLLAFGGGCGRWLQERRTSQRDTNVCSLCGLVAMIVRSFSSCTDILFVQRHRSCHRERQECRPGADQVAARARVNNACARLDKGGNMGSRESPKGHVQHRCDEPGSSACTLRRRPVAADARDGGMHANGDEPRCKGRPLGRRELTPRDRTEGFSAVAMDQTASSGHLEVVQRLHEHRTEGCAQRRQRRAAHTRDGRSHARWSSRRPQVAHENRAEGCSALTMDHANSLEMLRWLHENRTEGCTNLAMKSAARLENFEKLVFVRDHGLDRYTAKAAIGAFQHNHFKIQNRAQFQEPKCPDLDRPIVGSGWEQ